MTRFRRLGAAVALAVLSLPFGSTGAAEPEPGRTDWVTDPAWYEGGAAWNTVYGLSHDGRIVLAGMASPDPAVWDGGLAVRDMLTGEVTGIAWNYMATIPPTESDPVLSGDGRFVAFWSQQWGLDPSHPEAPGDQDFDLFVADWEAGVTRRVTAPPPANETDNPIFPSEMAISHDGRYVLYTTGRPTITDRGVSDTGGFDQLYRWDALTGLNTVVASRNGRDAPASGQAGMSPDGRYVVFNADLDGTTTGGNTARPSHLWEKDMATGRLWNITQRVAAGGGVKPLVSTDGSLVVFEVGDAYPLTGTADNNRLTDVVRWSRGDGRIELITKSSDGLAAAAGWSNLKSMSADGSTIVFLTSAENLVAGIDDPNNPEPGGPIPGLHVHWEDAYAWRGGDMHLVSRAAGRDSTGNRGVTAAAVSADGSTVVFESEASDLLSGGGDPNESEVCHTDVFAYSFAAGSTRLVSAVDDAAGYGLHGCGEKPYVDGDGSLVAFRWNERYVYEGRNASFVARRAVTPPFPPPPPEDEGGDAPARDPISPPGVPGTGPPTGTSGYWALAGDGAVYPFGAAPALGSGPGGAVDIEPVAGGGYLVLTSTGAVAAEGRAQALGGVPAAGLRPGERATSLSALTDGSGYWIFTDAGRVLPFGAAHSFGDLAAVRLNAPVLDSVATPSGRGYFMVAADGGVFAFGDARFAGSTGGIRLNAPVRSLVPDGDGSGYWLVAADGGVFAFDAPFRGSMGNVRLNRPVRGMVRYGNGYLMVAEDGGIFVFSDQPFSGSLAGDPPSSPVVGVAAYLP